MNDAINLAEQFPHLKFELTPADSLWPQLVDPRSLQAQKIYGIGDPSSLSGRCFSIVGARRATPYGIALAKMAGRIAAESGLISVSGGAIGVDIASARAALAAKGKTIIVSGTGADVIYPRANGATFVEAIETGGAVIALERWGTQPQRYTFPKRNRLIAALSRCLLVAEAGLPSGTLSTAQAAEEMGREIYAAPGSIFSPHSKGTNWLITQGATILADEECLEVAISRDYGVLRQERVKNTKDHGRLFSILLAEPMRPDELAHALSQDSLTLLKTLSDYEMRGLVFRLSDGRYAPSEKYLLDASNALS